MNTGRIIGKVKRVNGPIIEGDGITDAMIYELVRVGDENLVGEIIKLEDEGAVIQVYEDTVGLVPGAPVRGDNIPLSIELGPGLIGSVYDGIQRPLEEIRKVSGTYISKGIRVPSLDRNRKWSFTPSCAAGDEVSGGKAIGTVRESGTLRRPVFRIRSSCHGQ